MAQPYQRTVPLARAQSWFRRYYLFVLVPTLVLLLGALFFIRQETRQIQVLVTPDDGIVPAQPIQLVYNRNIERRNCRLELPDIDTEDIFLETSGNIQIATPRSLWPTENFVVEVRCGNQLISRLTLTLRSLDELSLEEQAEAQSVLDYIVATERKDYLESNEFINSFPVTKPDYTLRYLETDDVVYVVLKTPSTPSNREEIRSTIRAEITALGVPEEVPIVFPDEYQTPEAP